MSWDIIKNTFTTSNMMQSRNKRKRKANAYQRKPQKPLLVKTAKLNHSFTTNNFNSDLNINSQRLYKSDCESDEEIHVILADICTNADYNISSGLFESTTNKNNITLYSEKKLTNEQSLIKQDKVDLGEEFSSLQNSSIKSCRKDNLNNSYMLKNTISKSSISPLKQINSNKENSLQVGNLSYDHFCDSQFSKYQIKPIKPHRLCLYKNSQIQPNKIKTIKNINLENGQLEKENNIDTNKEISQFKTFLNQNINSSSILEKNATKKYWLKPNQLSLCIKSSQNNLKTKSNQTIKSTMNQNYNIVMNSNESYDQELDKSIIEESLSDDNTLTEDNYEDDLSKEIVFENSQSSTQKYSIYDDTNDNLRISCSQKSDLFPKDNETNIEYISSATENSTSQNNTKIITQTSTEGDEKRSLEGEKELDLLIRDLQYYSKKSKRTKIKKGGFVEKIRHILRSNRSNYFFWKNEFENDCIESGNYGEIIELYEYFTQTILKISVKNCIILIAVNLNNKIYKGQNFCIGTKVFFDIESFEPLVLDNGEKIYLGVNKIIKMK